MSSSGRRSRLSLALLLLLSTPALAAETVHCHPLTNDRTVAIAPRDLVRFLEDCGHAPSVIDLDVP